jgi:hypothetical protein
VGLNGTATLDFGAFPGASDASVAVTGQAGIVAGSLVEAWIMPAATADHTDTEHMVETFKVFAATIIAGTGFTIYGFNTSQLNEPLTQLAREQQPQSGGVGTRIYGKWNVGWVWS